MAKYQQIRPVALLMAMCTMICCPPISALAAYLAWSRQPQRSEAFEGVKNLQISILLSCCSFIIALAALGLVLHLVLH